MNKLWQRFLIILWVFVCSMSVQGCTKTAPPPYPTDKSNMLLEQGVHAHQQGRYAEAIYLFEQASSHFRSIDDQNALTLALLNLAETAYLIGGQERAYRVAHDAADLAKAHGRNQMYWRAKLLLARIQFEEDNALHALDYVEEFFTKQDHNAGPLFYNALILRADIAFQQEPTNTAWLEQVQALPITTPLFEARVLRLSALYHAASAPHLAEQEITAAHNIYRHIAFRPGIASALTQLSELYKMQERFDEAKEVGLRAIHVRAWLNDVRHTRQLLEHLAKVSHLQGEQEWAERARALAWELRLEPSLIRSPQVLESLDETK